MILIQPKINQLEQYIEIAKVHKIAFELMDPSFPAVLDDQYAMNRVLSAYSETNNYSVHGVFIDLNYSGGDPLIFDVSKKRIIECIKMTKKLNINKMVLHNCLFPILPETDMIYDIWCEDIASLLISLIEKYDMEFFIENVLDISPFVLNKLMQKVNHNKVGVCFDVGHSNLTKTPLDEWVGVLHPYIKYIHLSDNNGKFDDHLALGDGNIDFKKFGNLIENFGIKADYTLEVSGLDKVLRSIDYLNDMGLTYVK